MLDLKIPAIHSQMYFMLKQCEANICSDPFSRVKTWPQICLLIYSSILVSALIQDNTAKGISGLPDTWVSRDFLPLWLNQLHFSLLFFKWLHSLLFCPFIFVVSSNLLILHIFHQTMAALPFLHRPHHPTDLCSSSRLAFSPYITLGFPRWRFYHRALSSFTISLLDFQSVAVEQIRSSEDKLNVVYFGKPMHSHKPVVLGNHRLCLDRC